MIQISLCLDLTIQSAIYWDEILEKPAAFLALARLVQMMRLDVLFLIKHTVDFW
jgi:hypothetical protein